MGWVRRLICKIRGYHRMNYHNDICMTCGYKRKEELAK